MTWRNRLEAGKTDGENAVGGGAPTTATPMVLRVLRLQTDNRCSAGAVTLSSRERQVRKAMAIMHGCLKRRCANAYRW